MIGGALSERALVLAPHGRDANLITTMLAEAGMTGQPCTSLPELLRQLTIGAALVIVTEESLATADLAPLAGWIADQEEWSDLPFVLLTSQGGGIERNPAAHRYLDVLGNTTFIERPFHPTTLVSLVRSALRGRRRQYEARARLEAMREGARRYRTLFESIDEGFCVIEFFDGPHGPLSDYVHVEANPAYERHAGIPNVVGQTVRDMVPEEADGWVNLYRGVLITGKPIRFERELVATRRHLELAAFRVEPADRKQVAVLFQDVTLRKQTSEALRELNATLEARVVAGTAERNMLATIVETTDAQIQALDLDYRWLAINAACADAYMQVYGVRPRVGDSLLESLAHAPAAQAEARSVWERALAGQSFMCIGEFGDPARERRYYELSFETLRRPDGERIGAFLTSHDVTDRVLEQARLEQAEEALRQSQKMDAVGQLTGGVAHDFNNLLTIIKSSTDLLRRPGIAEERRARYVDAISETVDRASKLTSQLLAFARRQALKPEEFDVVERVRSITEMLTTLVGSRINLVTDLPPGECCVRADISQFETAIVNMAVNARDAMDQEGTLSIRVARLRYLPAIRGHARKAAPHISVSISDTGAGIAPDKLDQVFEPFFTTKEVGKGTGLGLSQVYGFAKQTGGDIVVESEVGRGATFSLYLPEIRGKASTDSAAAKADPDPVIRPQTLRVLVVEDNPGVGNFATQLLEDLGLITTLATNAKDALALLEGDHDFDVVFSDVVMPGMSGIELGRAVRRLYPKLPIVLTSGYSDVLAEEGRHGFELVQKPYSIEQLSRVLHRAATARL